MTGGDYATAKAAVESIRKRGWINQGDPVQTEKGNWVLPQVRILTYHPNRPHKRNAVPFEACYESEKEAHTAMERLKIDQYNLYRCGFPNGPEGNGAWRTDW